MVEMEAPQPMNDDGICSNSLKAVNIETKFLVDNVDASRVSAHVCERQLPTTTEVESLPTAVSEKEKCRFDAVKPRINDASQRREAVDELRAKKQTQLQATLQRYPEKWKSSLRFDEAFADILEQEGVPPAIITKVKNEPSHSRTAVFLDIVMEAELSYDGFKNALENTEQSDLVFLLKEEPRSRQEKEQIDRCVKMGEHSLKGTALKLWKMEKPSSRIALPGVGAPDRSAITHAQQSLVTITTDSKTVDAILKRYMRSTSDPLKIYEKFERDRIVGMKLTMTTVAVFLGCCLKLTLTIGSNDEHVRKILRRMFRTFKRHIAYWFYHNGGWTAWTTEMDRIIQARRVKQFRHVKHMSTVPKVDTEVAESLRKHCAKLDEDVLRKIWYEGRDVRQFVDRRLRLCNRDIEKMILELGPVSDQSPPADSSEPDQLRPDQYPTS